MCSQQQLAGQRDFVFNFFSLNVMRVAPSQGRKNKGHYRLRAGLTLIIFGVVGYCLKEKRPFLFHLSWSVCKDLTSIIWVVEPPTEKFHFNTFFLSLKRPSSESFAFACSLFLSYISFVANFLYS